MTITLYAFLVLFPIAKSPFIELSDAEVLRQIAEDEILIQYLDEYLTRLLTEATTEELFAADFAHMTNMKKEQTKNFWISYVEILIELDALKERYKTFYQLNAVTKPDLHRRAFQNGYSVFLAQHYYVLQLQKKVANPHMEIYLNEEIIEHGIPKNTYTFVRSKLTNPSDILQLNSGRAYHTLSSKQQSPLLDLIHKYHDEIDTSLVAYTNLATDKPLSFLERNSFKLWFPIQKVSAIQISYIRTSTREYHINPEQIRKYTQQLLPGDILLQRREWHATNVGIPGYWTHSALYLGSLEYLDTYFEGTPALHGQPFSELVKEKYPSAYSAMSQLSPDGYLYTVIESKRPGVILAPLEESASADTLAILRVNKLDKTEQLQIVASALSHFGKPYDFDFNFVTDSALVCSELVYKAFADIPKFSLNPKEVSGRIVVSPNQFAEKFVKEFNTDNAEMSLILFLDGNEKAKVAVEKDVNAFMSTWTRPKWHLAQDFAYFE